MRFIHISDLHIGKRLNEVNLLDDQKYILNQILEIAKDKKADAVLISGDIYDKGIPSVEAVALFDDFLSKLSERGVKIFIISGNHDNGTRLSFCNKMLHKSNIYIEGEFYGKLKNVTLTDNFGEINIYMLPFIRPSNVMPYFENVTTYNDAVNKVIKLANIDKSKRNIILSHQFVTGRIEKPETCESEMLSLGGSDEVFFDNYSDFDYVALGHIHKCQQIGSENIRYAGSPLKYSFSECNHIKGVLIVDLNEKGNVIVEKEPLIPLHDLREIKGRLEVLTDKAVYSETNTEDYIKVTLTDIDIVSEPMARLRRVYKNVMQLEYEKIRTNETNSKNSASLEDISKDPVQLFSEFYKNMNGTDISEAQNKIVKYVFEELNSEVE